MKSKSVEIVKEMKGAIADDVSPAAIFLWLSHSKIEPLHPSTHLRVLIAGENANRSLPTFS